MKKSKIVSIGLLALSVAACTKKHPSRHQSKQDWDQNQQQYYIDNNGTGNYYHGSGVSPFWIWWAYSLGRSSGGGTYVYSSPGVMYRGVGSKGDFHVSEFGKTSTMSRGSVSRGGFGRSGGQVGG